MAENSVELLSFSSFIVFVISFLIFTVCFPQINKGKNRYIYIKDFPIRCISFSFSFSQEVTKFRHFSQNINTCHWIICIQHGNIYTFHLSTLKLPVWNIWHFGQNWKKRKYNNNNPLVIMNLHSPVFASKCPYLGLLCLPQCQFHF